MRCGGDQQTLRVGTSGDGCGEGLFYGQGAPDHSGTAGSGKGDGEEDRQKVYGILQRAHSRGIGSFCRAADPGRGHRHTDSY